MAGQTALGRKVSFTSGMLSLTLEDAPQRFLETAAAALEGGSNVNQRRNGRRVSRPRLNALSESDDKGERTTGSQEIDSVTGNCTVLHSIAQ